MEEDSRMGRKFKAALVAAITVFSLSGVQGVAQATHESAQPTLNLALLDYTPIGYYGPSDEAGTTAGESATIPNPSAGPPPLNDPNPSGKYVAYDTNVWESLSLPSRHPGDNCNSLPTPDTDTNPDCRSGDRDSDVSDPVARTGYTGYAGPGADGTETPPNPASNVHGTCPPQPASEPEFGAAGVCFNNQLEYLDYYEHTMKTMLADFGVTVKRYPFHSPGRGRGGVPAGNPGASGGQAYNIGAVVPGADHPEETVLVSGHYDFTDTGPAAAWDSAEGHTEVIRMAYIMSDYWRQTGTRPSATIKFIPWDSEESGTFGSIDYVQNNIPPGQESKVRGYFNVDPCAGAYPAFKNGNFVERVPEVLQLADPAAYPAGPTRDRILAFNARALTIIDDVLDNLDDTLTTPAGEVPIFVSDEEAANGENGGDSQRDEIVTALGGLAIFSSDYDNFQDVGIPIFNLFPDMFGPHADGTPGNNDGIAILHTNNDNLAELNRLTSGLTTANVFDPTGLSASEGWAKGMEFCAQANATYMLQPEMAGTQTSNTNTVAYFEALPNEAIQNQNVTFDASGSYQYSDTSTRARQPESALSYQWDFGDGTTGTGKTVQHPYAEIGLYTATLTVTGAGGSTDTMTIPITVIGSNFVGPVLNAIDQGDAADGAFQLDWSFDGQRDASFQHFRVEEATDFEVLFSDNMENIATNWTVQTPTHNRIQPWQASDSSTPKFRDAAPPPDDNPHRSGDRSAWTGESPPFEPVNVVQGNSIMNTKTAIAVPQTGDPQLSYWSLFQNEGDDQGRLEVALTDGTQDPSDPHLEWMAVDVVQAPPTFVGDPFQPLVCDTANPDKSLTTDFQYRAADLGKFKGKQVFMRFNYVLGPENRRTSHPCGWYVEDVLVSSGNFEAIGTTQEETFQVQCRPNGRYGYRVRAVYTDNVTTAPSNVESAEVTDAKPDMSPVKITVKSTPRRGRKNVLASNIKNLSCVDAANVVVRFLDNGQQIGSDKVIALIPAGRGKSATVSWTPRSTGQHTISAIADPAGVIPETNEGNNTFNRTYQVRA
jgi:PKD repeat protein